MNTHPSVTRMEQEHQAVLVLQEQQRQEAIESLRQQDTIRFPQGYAAPLRNRDHYDGDLDISEKTNGRRTDTHDGDKFEPEVPLSQLAITSKDVEHAMFAHMDEVCCIKPLTPAARAELGQDEHCDRSHCADQMKLQGIARLGRRLRAQRKHGLKDTPPKPQATDEAKPTSSHSTKEQRRAPDSALKALKPSAQVLIDLMNDHTHPIKGCEYVLTHERSGTASGTPKGLFSQAECAVKGVAHRVAQYHDIDVEKVNSVLNSLGKDSTEIVARFASMFVKGDRSASTSHRDTFQPGREQSSTRMNELRTQLKEEMSSEFHRTYGRHLKEEEYAQPQSVNWEPVPEIILHDPGVLGSVNLSATVQTINDATSWGRGAAEQSSTLHELSKKSAAHVFQTHANRGSLSEASHTPPKGVKGIASMARGMATYVISAQGSMTQSVHGAVGGGSRAMRLAREASELYTLAREQSNAIDAHQRVQRGRRMSQLHPNSSYKDGIDGVHLRRLRHVNASNRLKQFIDVGLAEPPEGHTHTLGGHRAPNHAKMPPDLQRSKLHNWMLDTVDWPHAYQRMHEAIDTERERMKWWSEGAQGALPSGVEESWIGVVGLAHIPPSAFGRAARTLGHSIRHGVLPEWEKNGKMQDATAYHRDEQHQSENDEWTNAPGFMDGRKHTGGSRRLFEAYGTGVFGNWLPVPNSDESAAHFANQSAGMFERIVSYMVYNVFLCYLYKPKSEHSTQSAKLGDGTPVMTHRSQHMCFPGVPISIPYLPTFEELTGLDVKTIGTMDFNDVCGRLAIDDVVQSVANTFAAPFGDSKAADAMRRMFWNPVAAMHAISNLHGASTAHTTQAKTIHAACAISRMNGLIWTVGFLTLLIGVYLGCCWPCLNICLLCVNRKTRERRRRFDTDSSDDEETYPPVPVMRARPVKRQKQSKKPKTKAQGSLLGEIVSA